MKKKQAVKAYAKEIGGKHAHRKAKRELLSLVKACGSLNAAFYAVIHYEIKTPAGGAAKSEGGAETR